jgi:hypothetical protein
MTRQSVGLIFGEQLTDIDDENPDMLIALARHIDSHSSAPSQGAASPIATRRVSLLEFYATATWISITTVVTMATYSEHCTRQEKPQHCSGLKMARKFSSLFGSAQLQTARHGTIATAPKG